MLSRFAVPVVSAVVAALLAGCAVAPSPSSAAPTATTTASAKGSGREPAASPQVYVDGVALPVGLVFAPDGRLFFGEVTKGQVRVVEGGALRPQPYLQLDVAQAKEHGLLGLAIDPHFTETPHLYVYYTVPKRNGKPDFNRVVRVTERDGRGTDTQVILDRIPADVKGSHNGGRMVFGPDGKLYVSTGLPGDEPSEKQKVDPLQGKILRLNADGSVPADNPVSGSPVYASGLRNPYGIGFHPGTGQLYAIDNGPRGDDELNLIRPRGDYGWPRVTGASADARFVPPLWHSGSERLGLSGLAFYTGQQMPEYHGDLFFCLWNSGVLRRVRLAAPDYERVEQMEDLAVDCRIDVANGPDGALYVGGITQIYRLGR